MLMFSFGAFVHTSNYEYLSACQFIIGSYDYMRSDAPLVSIDRHSFNESLAPKCRPDTSPREAASLGSNVCVYRDI